MYEGLEDEDTGVKGPLEYDLSLKSRQFIKQRMLRDRPWFVNEPPVIPTDITDQETPSPIDSEGLGILTNHAIAFVPIPPPPYFPSFDLGE